MVRTLPYLRFLATPLGDYKHRLTPDTDSTVGKMMEKAGGMMKNEGLVEKGRERRASKGYGQDEKEDVQEGV